MSVHIVTFNQKAGRFELKVEELKDRLLQPDIRDREIIVISIAGAFRRGKSFLLSFFLKRLTGQVSR